MSVVIFHWQSSLQEKQKIWQLKGQISTDHTKENFENTLICDLFLLSSLQGFHLKVS